MTVEDAMCIKPLLRRDSARSSHQRTTRHSDEDGPSRKGASSTIIRIEAWHVSGARASAIAKATGSLSLKDMWPMR